MKLDISNNEITEKSFEYLENILQNCINTIIDISANPINIKSYRKKFKDSPIKFAAY
ncbi:hypothetical protein [Candidatus Paracaedibacter symbiosus]|uniref:hypothetical protein n=1 Tax=Candidatus Paracaedibacter symbiosus TaxID=244582 RepID=UPI0018DC8C2E|nr:hypothetical protein [Candidatus Paracaedibacter symbiosus]